MKESKIDRRIKYTKRMLHEALIELLEKKPISSISVTELCDKADINRSTFYAHYRDQFELLAEIEADTCKELQQLLVPRIKNGVVTSSKANLQSILEYIAENRMLFQIFQRNIDNGKFGELIFQMTADVLLQEIPATDPDTLEYMKVFSVSSSTGIINKWLDGGMTEPTDYIAELILRFIKHGVLGS